MRKSLFTICLFLAPFGGLCYRLPYAQGTRLVAQAVLFS